MNAFDAVAHGGDGLAQAGLHAGHGRVEHAHFIPAALDHLARQVAVGDAVEMLAGFVERLENGAVEGDADGQGQQGDQDQGAQRARHGAGLRVAGIGHRVPALRAGMGLIGIDGIDIVLDGVGQWLAREFICHHAVPAADGLVQGSQDLLVQDLRACHDALEQGGALRIVVGIRGQALAAVARRRQQGIGVLERGVARLLQAAVHIDLGVGQIGARLEQAAIEIAQIAGALDIVLAQALDGLPVVVQDVDRRRGGHREADHEHQQSERQRRADLEAFVHVEPAE